MPARCTIPVPGVPGDTYFFSGGKYARIRWQYGRSGDCVVNGPRDITASWPSLRAAGFNTIDASFPNSNHQWNVNVFRGPKYARIKIDPTTMKDTLEFGPHTIADAWPALKTAGFDTVDAILPTSNKDVYYFFCGTKFAKIHHKTKDDQILDEVVFGPSDIMTHFNVLKVAGMDTVDTLLTDPNDVSKAYMFSGHKYVGVKVLDGASILDARPFAPLDVATQWQSLAKLGFY